MPRQKEPFTLIRRKLDSGKTVYYFRLAGDLKRTDHSTGKTNRPDARNWVLLHFDELIRGGPAGAPAGARTLRQFAEPYYVWETCPHVARLLSEGKQITRRHAREQRRLLERLVWPDAISGVPVERIRRAELLDFRARLLAAGRGARTVNRCLAAVKTIFKEGVFREELTRNPCLGVGDVKVEARETGTFTREELSGLFPADPPGPWGSLQAYSCFLLAASTGMRKGELLALRWRAVDLSAGVLHVDEAWKDVAELGPPKWGRKRLAPLPGPAIEALSTLLEEGVRISADDLVFCDERSGKRLSDMWWRGTFAAGIAAYNAQAAEEQKPSIDLRGRNLKPHAFRHTLNTLLRAGGTDPARIRAALGWSNEKTQEGYTHWKAEHLREQADAIGKLFGG